jgi:hypothetical protein
MKATVALLLFLAITAHAQPYEPQAIWSREGAGDSSLYGSEILALGDQNDDGYNDWAVYGHGWGGPGQVNEPKVEFFHGGNPPSTEPYMVRLTETPVEEYLWGAKTLGDLNGDGYVDWAILVELTEDTLGRDIYKIYFGGPGPHEVPDLVVTAPWFSDYLPLGDFNGDGYNDLLLAEGVNNYAAIIYGGNPMDTLPDWLHHPILWVMGYGDVNHDGYSDFISDTGPVVGPQIFLGGENPDTLPAYNFPSLHSGATTIIHDLNDDSFDDLCFSESGWGRVIWGGLAIDTLTYTSLNFSCSGSGPLDIISAGDFNHDGYGDVIMLRQWCDNSYGGVLTLHLGHPWIYSEPAFVVFGWTDPLNLIHFKTAVDLGDINGDRLDDLGIGANGGIEYVAQRGKAVVLAGDTSLIADAPEPNHPLPQKLTVTAYPNPFNSTTTLELTLPAYASEITLSVYNLLGQEVFSKNLFPASTSLAYLFDAHSMSTGLYLLHVTSGSLRTTTKLMVLR